MPNTIIKAIATSNGPVMLVSNEDLTFAVSRQTVVDGKPQMLRVAQPCEVREGTILTIRIQDGPVLNGYVKQVIEREFVDVQAFVAVATTQSERLGNRFRMYAFGALGNGSLHKLEAGLISGQEPDPIGVSRYSEITQNDERFGKLKYSIAHERTGTVRFGSLSYACRYDVRYGAMEEVLSSKLIGITPTHMPSRRK